MPYPNDIFVFWYWNNIGVLKYNDIHKPDWEDWRLYDYQKRALKVRIRDICPHLKRSNIVEIPFDEIAYVHMQYPLQEFERVHMIGSVDISYPCIIAQGIRNPHNRPYVVLDGRHRMHRMRTLGMTKSKFYLVDKEVLDSNIVPR